MKLIMKKIFSISAILAACVLALGLSGCDSKELDTAQYSDKDVKLASFGPNPVMRGATLRFFGSNLDKIVEVSVPGLEAITDIEVVSSGNPSEIRIQLPVEGAEVGKVTLKSKDGKVLLTQSELTYTEPIIFDSFSPAEAMPGDVITVKGDYMNLVKSVTFEGGAIVTEIAHNGRHEASFKVPSKAITGKIILSDEGKIANLLYSEADLTIGDPTVKSLAVEVAKPEGAATITGSFLDMIDKVVFEGEAEVTALTLNEDATEISLAIPAGAKSGEVKAVSHAGKEFVAGEIEMVIPTGLAAAPAPVKAGATLEISGSDLDVVTGVDFPAAANCEFELADGIIKVVVPAAATEGDIALNMANGENVTVAYTLVHPAVTAVAPVELMAGETITVTGTDLDLVTGVTLGGKPVEFTAEAEKIVVQTANTSVSGKLVLTLANGEKVEPEDAITLSYDSFIIVNDMPAAEHIGAIVTLKGENFMMIENIYIGEEKVSKYNLRSDDEIQFVMPWNKVGTYSMYFHLLSGDVETCPQTIDVLLEQDIMTVWEGSLQITWNDGGRVTVPAASFTGIPAGSKLRFYYTQVDQQWDQAQLNYGNWTGINFDDPAGTVINGTLVPTDVYGWFTDGILDRCTEVVLTKEILENIQANKGDCEDKTACGIIIQGSGLTFTKIEIVCDIPQEVTIYEGPTALTWGDDGRFGLAMTYFEAAKPGSQLIFYLEQTENWGQAQLNDGWWANADMNFPEIGGAYITTDNLGGKDVTRIALTLTEEVLDHILATAGDYFGLNTNYQGDGRVGMVVQGSDMIINKVCIL